MDSSLAPVTIQQIIIFLEVVECGGFAKAGNNLHMTQSAVSKSIAKLESELGIILFQRTTREIHLTDAGKILYDEWKELVRSMHTAYVKAASVQNQGNMILRIGLLNTARPELFFWEIEERFTKKHPGIRLDLASEYMTDLETALAVGEYDLIMIPDFDHVIIEDMGLCWKWAACSHANIIMHKNHPLARRESLSMADILDENFAALEQKGRHTHLEDLQKRMAPYHAEPKMVPGYKNAYEVRYFFRDRENALLLVDEYYDYPDNTDLVKVPMIDQMNGIICAWNPANMKPQIQQFLDLLTPIKDA